MLTIDEFEDIRRRYKSGESRSTIASDYGITPGYVTNIGTDNANRRQFESRAGMKFTAEFQRLLSYGRPSGIDSLLQTLERRRTVMQ